MAEKLTQHSPEQLHVSNNEQVKNTHEKASITKEDLQHGSEDQLEAIQRTIEQEAISIDQHEPKTAEQNSSHPALVNKELKTITFNRTLTRVRKKLSAPARTFSKVIHNPIIEKSSEVVGNTVARPSGMLSGGFFALIGTTSLYWLTNKYYPERYPGSCRTTLF